jgi:YfiH family protein
MPSAPLLSPNLSALPSIGHAFFTRDWGNGGFSGYENGPDVHINRARMATYLAVEPQNLLSGYQVHSPDVMPVTEIWAWQDRPRVDALVTNKTGIALGILTADCVPVLFADDVAGVIGAAHAGWRGAVGGVIENTVAAMEKLGARRANIHAALGPCIWQRSYEVGSEFPAPFLADNPAHAKLFIPAPTSGHYLFDLPAYVETSLRDAGVVSIAPSPADTYAEPRRFFSYRNASQWDGGRLMSAIMRAG